MKRQAANKMEFDRALLNVFKEQFQVDVWLKPGDQTDAIPAHKLILVFFHSIRFFFKNIRRSLGQVFFYPKLGPTVTDIL